MSRYRKGYRLERRVERVYSKHGWLATRFPKSGRRLYPADVLAIKRFQGRTLIHLIECKNLSKPDQRKNAIYISREQIQRLRRKARQHHAKALVAYSFPYQHARILEANRLKCSGKTLRIDPEDGIPLKFFLKSYNQGTVIITRTSKQQTAKRSP